MKVKLLILVTGIVGLHCLSLRAQIIVLNGSVHEQGTNAPVPFANVWVTGYAYGTSTNADGHFEIRLNRNLFGTDHTLSFSCIGYKSKEIPLKSPGGTLNVTLQSLTTELPELVVYSQKVRKKRAAQARRLVHRAMTRIPKNYARQDYLLNTFYRHYCSENDNYVRLIESAMDIQGNKNSLDFVTLPEDKLSFKLLQLRRSFDFKEGARIYHPPISLNFLIANDFTSFDYHNPLITDLRRYNFTLKDTTNLGNQKVLHVEFEEADPAIDEVITYSGDLFIMQKNLAFIRAEITEEKDKIVGLDSIHTRNSKVIGYRQYQKKYYLDRVSSDVSVHHFSFDSLRNVVDSLKHDSHIELIANNILTGNFKHFKGKEPKKADLQRIKYDSTFWNSYTVLKATTLETKIIDDLSKKVSLDQQFEAFNTIESGGISVLESMQFKNIISGYKGTPLYIILWQDPAYLNFVELEPPGFFKRKIRKGKIKMILVGLNENRQDWMDARKYFGLNKSYVDHERLSVGYDDQVVKEYFNDIFPYFICVDRLGNMTADLPPMPQNPELKLFLKPLLKKSKSQGR